MGGQVAFTVPADAKPGQVLTVAVPAPPPRPPKVQLLTSDEPVESGQVVTVRIPEGAVATGEMDVALPDGAKVRKQEAVST